MFWSKKEEIPLLLRGLVQLNVGKKYNDNAWFIDMKREKPYNDVFTFEVYEAKRYLNGQSEIKILSVKNGKKVTFDPNVSYIVPSTSISWLMYDTLNLFNEYQELKNNKVGLNFDFHKSLEEFKSVKV